MLYQSTTVKILPHDTSDEPVRLQYARSFSCKPYLVSHPYRVKDANLVAHISEAA